ncbi:MAG: hypothetical protein IPM79_20290 [Polyangiaceae bacterium]|nr:hypothetical protein [Polyangiaceae bacterium]
MARKRGSRAWPRRLNEAEGDGPASATRRRAAMGVSLFPLGEPPRIYVGAPK